MYAVNEDGEKEGGGKVTAFSFDKANRKLKKINQVESIGNHPCYVTVDKTGKWVIAGNYSSGTVSVFPIAPDGGIGIASTTLQHQGSGPNKSRQTAPHVHATVFSPDNKYLFVPDLGIDKVVGYNFNPKKGSIALKTTTKLSDGSGPRHMDFHPNGKWAYVIQELTGTVTRYSYVDGNLRQLQEISLLPPDYKGSASSADIHVSPDGKFLYTSNRNPSNNITIFSIDQVTGALSLVSHHPTGGKVPRNFSFDPTGKLLLVANQESDNITIFHVDKETGKLTDTGKQIPVPNPVCLKWITVAAKKKK